MRPWHVLLVLVVVSVLVVDARRRKTDKDHDGSTKRKMRQTCLSLKAKKANSTATLTAQEGETMSSKFCKRVFKIRKHIHAKVTMCKAASAKPETERTEKEKKMVNGKWCKYIVKHGKIPRWSGRRKGKEGKRGSIKKMWKPCLALKAKNDNGTITLTDEESKLFSSPICKRVFAWSVKRAKCVAINGKAKTSLTKEEKALSKQRWCKKTLRRLRANRAKGRHQKTAHRSASGSKVKHPRRSKTRHGAEDMRISEFMLRRRKGIAKCKQEISKAATKDRRMKHRAFRKCYKNMMAELNHEANGRCQPITKVYNASSPVHYLAYAGRSIKPAKDSEGCRAMCELDNIHICRSAVFIDEANMCVLLMKLPKIAFYGTPSNTTELLRPCEACTTAIRFCNGTAPAQMKSNDEKGKRRSNRIKLGIKRRRKHRRRQRKGLKHIEEDEKKKGKGKRRRRQKKHRKLDNEEAYISPM